MTVHEVKTARLRLRPLAEADADALHRLWTHPAVRRYLWDDRVVSREETAAALETSRHLFESYGFGLWSVVSHGTLIGFGGYWFFREPPELELLYGIGAEHWGRGLATEVARALVRYGFEERGFLEVRASTDAPNVASARVLEKAGLRFDRRAVSGGLDTLHYRLSRSAFRPDGAPYALYPLQPPSAPEGDG